MTVRATERVSLTGIGPYGVFASGIFANAQGEGEGAGDAGTVVVEAPQVTLTGGAQIASGTLAEGRGASDGAGHGDRKPRGHRLPRATPVVLLPMPKGRVRQPVMPAW